MWDCGGWAGLLPPTAPFASAAAPGRPPSDGLTAAAKALGAGRWRKRTVSSPKARVARFLRHWHTGISSTIN